MRPRAAVTFLSLSGGDSVAWALPLLLLVALQVFYTWGDQTRRNVYHTLCFLPEVCSFNFCFYLGFPRGVKFIAHPTCLRVPAFALTFLTRWPVSPKFNRSCFKGFNLLQFL